jgi:hypothetical protein
MNLENKPHYHVVIATPGRQFHAGYVDSLVETTRWLSSEGLDYKLLNTYSSFVASARELTATNSALNNWVTNEIGGGEFTYDKVFWIDSDISWDVEDFVRIYRSELEIVSGLYQTDTFGTVAVNFPDNEGRPTRVNKVEFIMFDEPVEVGGVGFGFVAMKQGVFEKLPRPWFAIKKIKWPEHDFLTNVGEDYSWCYSATQNGFHIWVDPMVKVRHHKETVYEV